jgi:hypothetical protein
LEDWKQLVEKAYSMHLNLVLGADGRRVELVGKVVKIVVEVIDERMVEIELVGIQLVERHEQETLVENEGEC